MVEWWAWVFVVIGISMFVIGGFSGSRRLKKGEYGWYRRGVDGANAKAHCFLFTGERVPLISFRRYYALCRRTLLNHRGNWKRIEDPSPDITCPVCMDMVMRKTTTRFHLLPWKHASSKEAIIGGIGGGIGGTVLLYIIQGKVAWAYLFSFPIFTFILHLYLHKRREAKKEEKYQRVE